METKLPTPPRNEETLLSVLQDRSKNMPNHQIFTWINEKGKETDKLTYKELWDQSGLVAAALCKNPEISKGDRVMICYPMGLEFLAGLFGCMRAGVLPCSAYPPDPRKLTTDFPIFLRKAEDAGAKFALTTTKFRRVILIQQMLGSIGIKKIKWIATDDLKSTRGDNSRKSDDSFPSLEDIAFVQYSSGSTGSPKGVKISHRSLISNCKELTKVCVGTDDLNVTKGTVFVAWTPQYHDLGLIGQFMSSIYGAASSITFSPLDFILNPLLWHEMVVKYGAAVTQGPNFAFALVCKRLLQKQQIAEKKKSTNAKTTKLLGTRNSAQTGRKDKNNEDLYHRKWDTIRGACIGAEPVHPGVLEQMQSILGISMSYIHIGYGMAETGLFVASGSGNVHDGLVACGSIDGGISTIRVTKDGREVPCGTVGEIWVHSPLLVASGYFGQPELSKQAFENRLEGHKGSWLATGDLGKVINGEVYVTGRIKEVIIINGKNFYPVDLERTLEEKHPNVIRPGCTAAFQASSAGVGIVAEVRKGTKKEDIPDPLDIRKILTEVHDVSIVYVCLLRDHTVPKTTSGKLKRTETKEKSLAREWKEDSVLMTFEAPEESAVPVTMSHRDETDGGQETDKQDASLDLVHGKLEESKQLLQDLYGNYKKGSLRRGQDIGLVEVEEDWFWKQIPGLFSHSPAVGMMPSEHDELLPFIRSVFGRNGDTGLLRKSARDFLSHKGSGNSFSANESWFWAVNQAHSILLGITLTRMEIEAVMEIKNAVPSAFAPSLVRGHMNSPSDRERLGSKKLLMIDVYRNRAGLTLEQACFAVDFFAIGTSQISGLITCALITLYNPDSAFRRHHPNFKLTEENVGQFVWECIRLYPPAPGVVWRDNSDNNRRHAIVMSKVGLDKEAWGNDADSFRPDRVSASEFGARSCFFAEQSEYRCPSKSLALAMAKSFLLEFQSSGRWKSAVKPAPISYPPYFERFALQKLPRVIVIGGGAAGLTCALTLAKKGLEVTVLERNAVIGGHARHAKVFGGHERNPAFGLVLEKKWPNVIRLWDELGVERVELGGLGALRPIQFTEDGQERIGSSLEEGKRFIREINGLVEAGNIDSNQTIGKHLEANGFDDNFIFDFFMGGVINLFGGCTVQEYLDYPLHLVAQKFASETRLLDNTLCRVRNRQYMEAFMAELNKYGVVIKTGVDPVLLRRGTDGVAISVGAGREEILNADKLVLAVPPNAAAAFLGDHISQHEQLLRLFDSRKETMVLHQDASYLCPSHPDKLVHMRFPCAVGNLPSKNDTMSWTIADKSDTDDSTTILATYSYANLDDLVFKGPTERLTFTHVRQTVHTGRLQLLLKCCQGENDTYFAGGWTQGLMLHEDAIVSGIEAANSILTEAGERPQEVIERSQAILDRPSQLSDGSKQTELGSTDHKRVATRPTSRSSMRNPMLLRRRRSSLDMIVQHRLESSAHIVRQAISSVVGREVSMDETMGDLGLSSMELASVHSKIQTDLDTDVEPFPVARLFDTDLTVGQLMKLVSDERRASLSRRSPSVAMDMARLEEICESLMVQMEELVGLDVVPMTTLASTKLSPEQKVKYHRMILTRLELSPDRLPLSWLSEADVTFDSLASRILTLVNTRTQPTTQNHQITRPHPEPLRVPVLVEVTRALIQMVAVISPALFVAMAVLPAVWVAQEVNTTGYSVRGFVTLGLLSPVFGLIYTFSATVLLIAFKWILVGRQRPVHQAVWSGSFARRWIVRQCSRHCWDYTGWAYLGGTDLLCQLHRLLGSNIGKGVSLLPGAIEDFDLVSIGDGTTVKTLAMTKTCTFNTEAVSLGVQTLRPISVGRRCIISARSLIDQGSVLEDDVFLEEQTMISRGSVLKEGSRWHGTPARPSDKSANASGLIDSNNNSDASRKRRGSRFQLLLYILAFVVTPYLLAIQTAITIGTGYLIWRYLGGLWGLAALIWVPITASLLFVTQLCIACKWILLGRVKPGIWPKHGSFHMRKQVVDHILSYHVVFLRQFATLVGSPVANSFYLSRVTYRSFGAKVGAAAIPREWIPLCYDLFSSGDGAFLSGACAGRPFMTEGDSLIARSINIGSGAFAGLRSMIQGGVTIADHATVAAYSYATQDVASDEVVFGTEIYRKKPSASLGTDIISFISHEDERAGFLVALVSWFHASILVVGVGFLLRSSPVVLHSGSALMNAFYISFLSGSSFCLGIPCYAVAVLVLTKLVLTGRFTPRVFRTEDNMKSGFLSRLGYLWRYGWTLGLNNRVFRPFAMQAFAGTSLEVALHRALGASIGQNAFLDNVFLFEPDLISIGHNVTINKGTLFSPHQVTPFAVEYARIRIGDRCTVGTVCAVHGRAVMDDDTEMLSMSMPLIGTHMTPGGRWEGYPAAKRIEQEYVHPPRLPLPAWYVLLQHPMSIVLGLFWAILLFVDDLGCCFARKKRSGHGSASDTIFYKDAELRSMSLPPSLSGLFIFGEGSFVRFDNGVWSEDILYLRMDGFLCVMPRDDNDDGASENGVTRDNWWNWATYHWTFSSDMIVAHGHVSLGWWTIPMEILTATLHREGDDWVWSHSWFGAISREVRVSRLGSKADAIV